MYSLFISICSTLRTNIFMLPDLIQVKELGDITEDQPGVPLGMHAAATLDEMSKFNHIFGLLDANMFENGAGFPYSA